MIAVVETHEFLADVNDVLSEGEREALVLYLARHPDTGDLMPQTGGLRKLRWTSKGQGKRGGSTIFEKNVQSDLTPRQRKALAVQLAALKSEWKERRSK